MSVFSSTVASVVAGMALIAAGIGGDLLVGKASLPQIVKQLEEAGYGPFSEADFDDGKWEIEVVEQDKTYEIKVNPDSGKVISKKQDDIDHLPPTGAKPLSEILNLVVQAGYFEISEVDFKKRYWEIEARKNDGKHEIRVDPNSGKVISDWLDD